MDGVAAQLRCSNGEQQQIHSIPQRQWVCIQNPASLCAASLGNQLLSKGFGQWQVMQAQSQHCFVLSFC